LGGGVFVQSGDLNGKFIHAVGHAVQGQIAIVCNSAIEVKPELSCFRAGNRGKNISWLKSSVSERRHYNDER
jgi:hypothetical protein